MKVQRLDSRIYQFIKNSSIAALFIGAAIFFYSCENDIEKIKAFSTPENLATLEATNFITLFTDSGTVRFSLKTPKLLRFENEGVEYLEFPKGIEIVKFDSNKKIISSITSDYAKQFVKEQKWEAKNNVVATNELGDTLKTELLIWEEKTEEIYTDEFVEIIRADEVYTGIGLTADQNLAHWKIKKLKGIAYVSVNRQKSGSNNTNNTGTAPTEKKDKAFSRPPQFEK